LKCPRCGALQPIGETDYFTCLGLKRTLVLDAADLENRFHERSRWVHPDYFQKRSEREQAVSLENASLLNTAYRTLKDRIRRMEYLLELEEGVAKIPAQSPTELLEEILELQEAADQLRRDPSSASARASVSEGLARLSERREALEKNLDRFSEQWDRLSEDQPEEKHRILQQIKEELAHRAYLDTMMEDLNQTVSGEKDVTYRRH
jgi:molecular chaperone HscB